MDIHCSGSFSHHEFYSFIFMSKISTRVVCVNGKHRRNTGTPRNVHVEICQIERTECSEVCFGVPGFITCLDKPLQGAKLGFFRGGGTQCVTPMVLTCTCHHPRNVLLKETLFWMSSERGEGKSVQNNCKDDLRDEKDLKWLPLKC